MSAPRRGRPFPDRFRRDVVRVALTQGDVRLALTLLFLPQGWKMTRKDAFCGCGRLLIACLKCGDSRCLGCDPYDNADTCASGRTLAGASPGAVGGEKQNT